MPEMSRFESAFCRSAPWRAFAGKLVSRALQGVELKGDVLEIGCGSGAMAAEILRRFPDVRFTATDFDEAMVAEARGRLAKFGDRVAVERADATRLPYEDGRFDAVLLFIMLHHVIDWEPAVREAVRVLRPGGVLVGYDVVASPPARFLHAVQRETHRLVARREFADLVSDPALGLAETRVRPALGGLAMRFRVQKAA